jgi:FkbM family methyltransferase
MSLAKHVLRDLTPHGLIEARRRRFRLQRLGLLSRGLPPQVLEKAATDCHYELWPEFLRREHGWTLLDVGANEGDFVRAAALVAKPGAVFAFEPQPACKPLLEAALAAVPNGRMVAAAVGAAPGQVEFNCTGNSKMASVLAPQPGIERSYQSGDYAIVENVTVPIVRLDDVVPAGTDVGLLKLDVQGYEMEALRGAIRVLSETRVLLVEANYVAHYQGTVEFDALHRFLADASFRLHGISAPFVDEERPLWADAMYVRRGL